MYKYYSSAAFDSGGKIATLVHPSSERHPPQEMEAIKKNRRVSDEDKKDLLTQMLTKLHEHEHRLQVSSHDRSRESRTHLQACTVTDCSFCSFQWQ